MSAQLHVSSRMARASSYGTSTGDKCWVATDSAMNLATGLAPPLSVMRVRWNCSSNAMSAFESGSPLSKPSSQLAGNFLSEAKRMTGQRVNLL